jgi:hypothetical protein
MKFECQKTVDRLRESVGGQIEALPASALGN